jgi:glutathione S-transferase
MIKLYSFFNSSTSYRVRIALALKGLAYDYEAVNLRSGEQRGDAYRELSPAGIVPVLIDGDVRLTQ